MADSFRMTLRLREYVEKEVWSDLVRVVGNWREEIMTYFETDMPVTNAYTESIYQPSEGGI